MALPFTDQQREEIRRRLFDSACRHALTTGVKKTSLDTLTAEAGIAKSSFYKFYESKEMLFLDVAARWEAQILHAADDALTHAQNKPNKARAASVVYAAFEEMHRMGIVRFLREDMPLLTQSIPQASAKAHFISSAEVIFSFLRRAQIRFTEPDDKVLSCIQLLYLSILNIGDVGDQYFSSLQLLVSGACDRLVA